MFTACFPVGVTRRFTALEHCRVPLFSMAGKVVAPVLQDSACRQCLFLSRCLSCCLPEWQTFRSWPPRFHLVFGPGQLGNRPLSHWLRGSWWLPHTAGRFPESVGAEVLHVHSVTDCDDVSYS